MKKRSSSIIYIIVIALLIAAALLCLLAFTKGKLPGLGSFTNTASSENESPRLVNEGSGILPEAENPESGSFFSGLFPGDSSDVSDETDPGEAAAGPAEDETVWSSVNPSEENAEAVSASEASSGFDTEAVSGSSTEPTTGSTPEPSSEPTPAPASDSSSEPPPTLTTDPKKPDAAGYLSDLETVPASTLVDLSLLDSENIGQYFQSYEISDALFERIYGDNRSYKTYCTVPREHLRYIKILYNDFEGNTRVGEIMVNYLVADDILYIFEELYKIGYPFELIVLVDDFEADDDISILHNNTSCFNYRNITGSNYPSNHAYGTAIDINPYNNPYIIYDEYGNPSALDAGADQYLDRDAEDAYERHMINYNDPCYQLFTQRGWAWGGDWSNPVDYQHFEKVIYP